MITTHFSKNVRENWSTAYHWEHSYWNLSKGLRNTNFYWRYCGSILSQSRVMSCTFCGRLFSEHFLITHIKSCSFFLSFDIVSSEWSFSFFIPAITANDLQLRRIFIPNCIHYFYFPILILRKDPVFSLFNVEF